MPAYMQIDGITGEAQDTEHSGWIQIDSMSSDIHRSVASGSKGPDRKRGTTMLGDISVTRTMDTSSVPLQLCCAKGEVKNPVKIDICTQEGGKSVPYMQYVLGHCIISGYMVSSSSDGVPQENITLNFENVEWKYIELDEALKPKGNFPGTFNPSDNA